MPSLKKKFKKDPAWQKKLVEVLRYGFFVFYIACLIAMIMGARWLAHWPEQSGQKLEERMRQRMIEIEKQHAEEALAAQQAPLAPSSEQEALPPLVPEGNKNAPA